MITTVRRAAKRRIEAIQTIDSISEIFSHSRIFILAAALTIVLRLRLSKPLLALLESMETGGNEPSEERLRDITRRTDTVLLLGRPAIRSECLARTCLLYYQMKKAGADVNIRFGVAMAGSEFRSHCWLLVDGLPQYEHFDPRPAFKPLYDLSPQSAAD